MIILYKLLKFKKKGQIFYFKLIFRKLLITEYRVAVQEKLKKKIFSNIFETILTNTSKNQPFLHCIEISTPQKSLLCYLIILRIFSNYF